MSQLILPALLLFLAWSLPVMAIEEPAYRVVEQEGNFQLREYASYLLAETRVAADFEDAGSIAFGRLFRYISGGNQGKQKVAMTAPVRQEAGEAGSQRVAFVVPAEFSRATVPVPGDPQISIREQPAQRVAALRYSGRWTEANYRDRERSLRDWMSRRGLKAAGPAVYARYNAPFVPWPLRRNEVMVPVEPATP